MGIHEGYGKTKTDESLREAASHGSEEYPFQYYLEDIWQFDFHCIDWHWHPEVEFVFLEKGKAEFLIGSDRYVLDEGAGVFINSQVIHRFEAAQSAVIPNIVFSPELLSSKEGLLYRKYIKPILESPVESLIFSIDDPGHKDILKVLRTVFAVQDSGIACEIRTVELLLKLWRMIYEHIGRMDLGVSPAMRQSSARTQAQLQIMMQYIHKNYPFPISLDDIAKTVALSKSSVLHIFNNNIHVSPVNYLIGYRLKRAAKLLATTQDSVALIARDTGFENTGYFCRKFKEIFHMTPGEYRKREKR